MSLLTLTRMATSMQVDILKITNKKILKTVYFFGRTQNHANFRFIYFFFFSPYLSNHADVELGL